MKTHSPSRQIIQRKTKHSLTVTSKVELNLPIDQWVKLSQRYTGNPLKAFELLNQSGTRFHVAIVPAMGLDDATVLPDVKVFCLRPRTKQVCFEGVNGLRAYSLEPKSRVKMSEDSYIGLMALRTIRSSANFTSYNDYEVATVPGIQFYVFVPSGPPEQPVVKRAKPDLFKYAG